MMVSLADCKADVVVGGGDDAILTRHVKAASEHLAKRLGFEPFRRTVVERFDGGKLKLELAARPVESITSVKESSSRDWAGTTALVADSDYLVRSYEQLRIVQLERIAQAWLGGQSVVRVEYIAGWVSADEVTPPETAIAFPEDLRLQCIRLAVHSFANRHRPGAITISTPQGDMAITDRAMLASAEDVAAGYRRVRA
jgi:hypothetical protein